MSRLPLRADPVTGALVGTFLLALCLAGPVGLVLALIVWGVIAAVRRSRSGASLAEVEGSRDHAQDRRGGSTR